jgi:glycosyltransferase involved in cell wall biosynthesis
MKVLYDHQIFSISMYGGALRYFTELINRVAKKEDIETSVYMNYFISEYGLEKSINNFKYFKSKKHGNYKNSKPIYLFWNKLFFPAFFDKAAPHIYHQTYYENLCLNKKVKRIVTVLDMMHEKFPESFSKFDKSASDKREAVKRADGIISISHSTKKDLIEMLNVPEEKIRVIHLGNSLNKTTESKPIVNQPYLLYVAKRLNYKNFEMLVKVFAKLKRNYPELKVVCSGGGTFSDEEIKLFESLGVKEDIIYFNANDKMLANLYKHAEAFIYPSRYEGFGVSLLEAMNMKCPIIASNSSSIPEILGDAGLYINPDEPEDLENKIEMLLNNKNLRDELIQKGLIQKEKFNWDKTAEETIKYYKEILGNE